MANFDSAWGGYKNDATHQSVVVDVPDPAADLDITVFRFPVSGRLRGARVIPRATLAAGTANHFQVALYNGGSSGTAQTVISGTAGGTVGWVAQTAQSITINTSAFAAGEYVVLDYDETGTVAPAFVVQLDYDLDPTD